MENRVCKSKPGFLCRSRDEAGRGRASLPFGCKRMATAACGSSGRTAAPGERFPAAVAGQRQPCATGPGNGKRKKAPMPKPAGMNVRSLRPPAGGRLVRGALPHHALPPPAEGLRAEPAEAQQRQRRPEAQVAAVARQGRRHGVAHPQRKDRAARRAVGVPCPPYPSPKRRKKQPAAQGGCAAGSVGDAAPPVAKRPPKGRYGGTFRGGRNAGAQRAESRSYTRRTGGSSDTAMQITVSTPMERAL